MKKIIIGACTLLITAMVSPVMAQDSRAERLDRQSERINKHLDKRGDRIDRRFDRKGDRINRRFDRKSSRADRRWDRRMARKGHLGWQHLNRRKYRSHQMYAWSKNWNHKHMHSWPYCK